MKNRFVTRITTIVTEYFRPWRAALIFGLGVVFALLLAGPVESTSQFTESSIRSATSFHIIPVGHREIVVTNFQGSLTWYERGQSNKRIMTYPQSNKIPPIKSVNGKIVASVPFQATSFSLTGKTTDGNDLPHIEIRN